MKKRIEKSRNRLDSITGKMKKKFQREENAPEKKGSPSDDGSSDTDSGAVDNFKQRHRGTITSVKRGWDSFTDSKIGVIGLGILIVFILVSVFAPFLAPHDPDWQAPDPDEDAEFGDDPDTLEDLADVEISHPAGPKFGELTGDPYFAPLGTDDQGHDLLTQLLYGSQTTLYIGLAAALLSSLIGIPLGIISGYYADTLVDESIQRFVDVMFALPFLPLVIILIAINGITTTNIIIAIAIKSWLMNAIVLRGETMKIKERDFVESAKISGASRRRILGKYILPNVIPLAFIYLAQDAAFAIITHASLAFLGLADFSDMSWGLMLYQIRITGNVYDSLWWLLPPGLLITLVAAAFYFIGYSLEDVMNPQQTAKARNPDQE